MNLSTVSGIRFSNLWQVQVGYNLHSLIFVTKQYNDSDEEATSYTTGKVTVGVAYEALAVRHRQYSRPLGPWFNWWMLSAD